MSGNRNRDYHGRFVKGHIVSEETKRKLSKSHDGKPSNFKGRHFSEESKRKSSLAHIGKNKGSKRTKKTKLKMRLSAIKRMQRTQSCFTSIEIRLYNELKRRKVEFIKQCSVNDRFVVDAYIPSLNLIIEVDGNYWHSKEKCKKKDKTENAYLTTCGYKLLRISETDINNNNFISILNNYVR